mmetsp:Transcript_12590/g.32221  ORF Transcript_12590/g.32221 Transcript_12590/m.32221 type:complete len:167 (+) Transcript_12590:2-502(+)
MASRPSFWVVLVAAASAAFVTALEPPATDCSQTIAHDPDFFDDCDVSESCLRVHVVSMLGASLNIGNSTDGPDPSIDFRWCIDHINGVVYSKEITPQTGQPPYHVSYFEVDDNDHPGHSCRFLATHWSSGDIVNVYQEDNINCTREYVPSQLPGPDGVTNATIWVG